MKPYTHMPITAVVGIVAALWLSAAAAILSITHAYTAPAAVKVEATAGNCYKLDLPEEFPIAGPQDKFYVRVSNDTVYVEFANEYKYDNH